MKTLLTFKNYYCKCGNKIAYSTWYYGKKNCHSCANRKRRITLISRKKMSQSRLKLNLNKYKIFKKFLIVHYLKNKERIKDIAKIMGCSYGCIYKKLLKYNLSREKIKGKFNRKGKNNPMFGKRGIDNPNWGKKYPKQSKKIRGRNNPMFGKRVHGKGDFYKDIWMRSSYEIAYAKWLDKNNIKWKYESKTFDLGNTTYTPDFYLPKTKEYIEIKGWWRKKSIQKFKLFKHKYTYIKIKVLRKKDLIKLHII